MGAEASYRVLVVDDNAGIHDDYRKILLQAGVDAGLVEAERALFGTPPAPARVGWQFDVTFASQGEEALGFVTRAAEAGRPFAVAFVDVVMPPGIDGIETCRRLWAIDPDVQVVICSAYSDVSWAEMATRLGAPERWVILKKPFETVEVLQLAHALADKWTLRQQTKAQVRDLEDRVARRTADLAAALEKLRSEVAERERSEAERQAMERRLEETQRLESLGVLAGGVAHDFNNILAGILISASLARLGVGPGTELHKHLQLIEENSRRAAGLCEQLLTYAGKNAVDMQLVDANALVNDTLELLGVTLPKDAEFTLELGVGLPAIRADASRLRQVLMNLVLNAAEALAAPPRRIRLATGHRSVTAAEFARMVHAADAQPGEYVFFEVSDTGVGMSAEAVGRMFEPFYTTKFAGRGLGLSAVLGIMRAHRGAVDVTTAVGGGCTFRVWFPALAEPAPVRERTPQAPQAARGRGTVLVADDEEAVRVTAAAVLANAGFGVLLAADGAEAVAAAERHEGALTGVLLDVTMPRMDGPTALEVIRRARPDVPMILMTGYYAAEFDTRRRTAGFAKVTILQKPFSADMLTEAALREFGDTARGAP